MLRMQEVCYSMALNQYYPLFTPHCVLVRGLETYCALDESKESQNLKKGAKSYETKQNSRAWHTSCYVRYERTIQQPGRHCVRICSASRPMSGPMVLQIPARQKHHSSGSAG